MQQLTQKLDSGDMIIQEVPYPLLGKGMVIVKNHYSIISAGTEGYVPSNGIWRNEIVAKETPVKYEIDKNKLDVFKEFLELSQQKNIPLPTIWL